MDRRAFMGALGLAPLVGRINLSHENVIPCGRITVSLHTGSPGRTGANESMDLNYHRQPVRFGKVVNGTTCNLDPICFAKRVGWHESEMLTHCGFWVNGEFSTGAALDSCVFVERGAEIEFAEGDLDFCWSGMSDTFINTALCLVD